MKILALSPFSPPHLTQPSHILKFQMTSTQPWRPALVHRMVCPRTLCIWKVPWKMGRLGTCQRLHVLHSVSDPHPENVKVGIQNGKRTPSDTWASLGPICYHHNFSIKQLEFRRVILSQDQTHYDLVPGTAYGYWLLWADPSHYLCKCYIHSDFPKLKSRVS